MYDKLCEQAEAVRTADDLARLLLAVVEDGRRVPPADYWQWNLDHLFLEMVANQLELLKDHRPIVNLPECGEPERSEPIGDPRTAEDAFRYMAEAIVRAIVYE